MLSRDLLNCSCARCWLPARCKQASALGEQFDKRSGTDALFPLGCPLASRSVSGQNKNMRRCHTRRQQQKQTAASSQLHLHQCCRSSCHRWDHRTRAARTPNSMKVIAVIARLPSFRESWVCLALPRATIYLNRAARSTKMVPPQWVPSATAMDGWRSPCGNACSSRWS